MTILIKDANGDWREPSGHGYENEAALQEIIYRHPSLVPGVTGDVVACREFQSGVGPADVVVLDADGAITVVECKLAANPQVRREVIGQALDYASRLWQMSVHEFEAAWTRAVADRQSPFAALDDADGRIRAAVEANLAEGRMNLVLAVDRLNGDLRRIVEFLNAVTRPSTGVIVVEFSRVHEDGVEILIPAAYGTELVEAKNASSAGGRPRWTIDQYRDWIAEHDPASMDVFKSLLGALHANGFQVGGGRAQTPSMYAGIEIPRLGRRYPICLYTDAQRGGLLEVRFSDFRDQADAVDLFAQLVSEVPGMPLSVEEIRAAGYRKRPNVPFRELTPAGVEQLAAAIGSMGEVSVPRPR